MSQSLCAIPSLGSLDAYVRYVQNLPMLSAEEEHHLALRLQQKGDVDAARQLVLSHLKYVVKVARGFSGYGLATSDLIQEGNMGLMKAVKRFDPEHGARLASFAIYWIKAEIHEFVLKNWRQVKVATTKAQRKLFFKLRRYQKQLQWLTQDEIDTIATDLNVPAHEVITMEQRLAAHDSAFDEPHDDDNNNTQAPNHYLSAPEASPEQDLIEQRTNMLEQQALMDALEKLDPRERDIIEQRWLKSEQKSTLHDLAAQHQVSAERIRQLERQALQRLQTAIQAATR